MSQSKSMNYQALGWAIALCVVMAVTEVLLGTEGLVWYGDIEKPTWHLPIAGWGVVVFLVYLLNGFIAYRLLSVPLRFADRVIGLTALGIVMLFNAFWTYAFFATESTLCESHITMASTRTPVKPELTQQPPVEPEVDPQPLGDGEHKLPMRHLGAHMLADPTGLR